MIFNVSGELVAEGCNLGKAHPPGYPLYTLIMHFIHISFNNSSGFYYNLASACFGSLASYFLGLSTYHLSAILHNKSDNKLLNNHGSLLGALLTMVIILLSLLFFDLKLSW